MTFIQALLDNPSLTIISYPPKKEDIKPEDFDSLSLEERVYYLYSIMSRYKMFDDEMLKVIGKYKDEVDFLNFVLESTYATSKNSNTLLPSTYDEKKKVNEWWSNMLSRNRQLTIDLIL